MHPFRVKGAIVALQDRGEYCCGINLIKSVSLRCSFNSAPFAKRSIAIASSRLMPNQVSKVLDVTAGIEAADVQKTKSIVESGRLQILSPDEPCIANIP